MCVLGPARSAAATGRSGADRAGRVRPSKPAKTDLGSFCAHILGQRQTATTEVESQLVFLVSGSTNLRCDEESVYKGMTYPSIDVQNDVFCQYYSKITLKRILDASIGLA